MFNYSKVLNNSGSISVSLVTGSNRKAWDDYVLCHPMGIAFQLYAWKEAVEGAYGFECPYFIALENNIVRGVLPTARIRRPFSRGTLVSLPYCDAGGPLADSKEIEVLLLNQALTYARQQKIRTVEVRALKAIGHIADAETVNKQKVRMRLPLPEDAPSLLSGFKAKLRSQVRKPQKDGLSAVIGGVEMVADFYPVFVENMRDLGSPVHSKKWFSQVLDAYGKRARCCVVYMPDNQPAAGGVILCHPETVSIPWASSLRRLNQWNPNMLLYWTLLEYAANQGYHFFDFGRSTPGEGTYRFKKQWGARSKPLHWARFNASDRIDEKASLKPVQASGSHGKVRDTAAQLIQRMPLGMSQWMGSRLRRYISL